MRAFKQLWLTKPAAVIAVVNAIIILGASFGLALSGAQTAGIAGVLAAIQLLTVDRIVVSRQALDELVAADWPPPPDARPIV